MAKVRFLEEIRDLHGKRVLLRVDFNVPLKKGNNGEIEVADDTRIVAALPTIEYLVEKGAKVIILSHLGRPKGKRVEELSLLPVAKHLAQLMRRAVMFSPETVGEAAEMAVKGLEPGDVLVLENVRFYPGEEKNDPEFARKLASYGDVFVSDAFSVAHRAHASNVGVATYLKAYAGYLMMKEIEHLGMLLNPKDRPYYVLLGGAKVSDKIGVIDNLLDKVDGLFIGGGMAFTFLKALGKNVGRSIVEEDYLDYAVGVIEKSRHLGKKFVLPVDVVIGDSPDATEVSVTSVDNIPADKMGLDIGPESIELFKREMADGKLFFWNGPMGVFENPLFAKGTEELAHYLAELCQKGAKVVVGGGDSAAAVKKFEDPKRFTHISTGGGASLKFVEGKKLPGIEVLKW